VTALSFFSLPLPSLLHSHVGESERAVQAAFDAALKAAPAVLFIDEIDSLFAAQPQPASDSVTTGIVAVLASLLSAVTERRLPVLLLAASNLPHRIHPSLLSASRISLRLYVPPPSVAELRLMLQRLMAQQGMQLQLSSAAGGQDEQRLDSLLSGLTAADLRYLVGSLTVAVRGAGGQAASIAELEAARRRQSGSVTEAAEAALRRWATRTVRM
jgi:SpoVK/Ycf46/Vps4 family AAA+-type ATPase